MMTRELGPTAANLVKIAIIVLLAVAGISLGVLLFPILVGSLSEGGPDWSRLSEVGEAYGPISALVASLALVATVVFGSLQHRQFGQDRLRLQREMTFNLLKVAMDDPSYAQCWGPRVSPREVDERHFYYVNLILMLWSHAWEHQQVADDQVRRYARMLFDSEVSRLYWAQYGGLRSEARRQDRAFHRMINDEYVKAVANGPPSRPYEPAHRSQRHDPAWPTNSRLR